MVDLGMREECKYFLQGSCRFGNRCKYLHIRRTALIDPPAWIHSCFPGVNTHEVSPDEARLRFLDSPGTFQKEWDDLFIHNYFALCQKLDTLLLDSKVGSFTQRCVDMRDRRNLGKLVPVFDRRRLTEEMDTRNRGRRQQAAEQRYPVALDSRQPIDDYTQGYSRDLMAGDGGRGRDGAQHRRDTRSRDYGDPGRRMLYDSEERGYGHRSGYYRENMHTKDNMHRDRQSIRNTSAYGKYPPRGMDDREGTVHPSRGRSGVRGSYRDSYGSTVSAGSGRSRGYEYDYNERGRGSGGRGGDARGRKGDTGDRQQSRHNEDTVDLMHDDVVIDDFLPNDETDELEF